MLTSFSLFSFFICYLVLAHLFIYIYILSLGVWDPKLNFGLYYPL